eukprot:CAMPEP_0184333008 /NCGR_PEP_ID=MMETSP1089-20130417/2094_1 /TAXON_ID=38269 ORGANISM="Gloeochaete wittrockiana, Strain SAG46.84" /NCGR_SAMPLE_ID=MMETSP1089 /ASSEMBLY_ACC=CAM_ASM_000445 /LENGTH=431 /DNA_ID=CAMNT_0026656627 /DNA_START=221 /DNA_END=1516 /DNA_ORIENTATION=+
MEQNKHTPASNSDARPQGPPVKQWHLDAEHELRFETESPVQLKLLSGTAEIFGTELAPMNPYKLPPGTKTAVFTWYGCDVEVEGTCAVCYVANETPMVSYLNTHAAIEARRTQAEQSGGPGPRVMLVGPTDSGKSSLSRILLGYAVRRGRRPTFVDLDIGQGQISIPGCIAATPIDRPVDVQEGFNHAIPLVYFYGHVTPTENAKHFKLVVSRLAEHLISRTATEPVIRSSGMIINTMGWVDGLGYDLLLHCMQAFEVDVALVLGHERLYVDLTNEVQGKKTSVVKLAKSGGVVTRDPTFRRKSRMDRIREYFYGVLGDLCPHSTVLSFKDVSIFKVGGGPQVSSALLPVGAAPQSDPTRLIEVIPSKDLIHSIIGVSHAAAPDFLLEANLAGFLYVTDVDVEKQRITCLAPSPGPLPSRYVIVGTLKWFE